ncbi:LPXTG-motif cell wall-anchored protein [Krasilnikovia cinnamomea]|uniref:LPXTG-motif cell wall-anchored protein n=1 Tax=Krasilnikovia cinnamomea TaxID=349313 RepID=A0A4Q7ZHV1_9ACTN|nr:LPXTG cell wall anchor domain-containing protein [Krasilnikovia cinnamomea]RZU49803.1 LPXTG-motif cell wall-anchored protein [Krasilnikovia cinnamomea]
MKVKTSLHRTATVLAGALIGLAGLTVAATPASAHASSVKGDSVCNAATGKRDITWTLTNDWGGDATVSDLALIPGVKAETAEHNELKNGVVIPRRSHHVDGKAVFTQSAEGDITDASISFTAHWDDEYSDRNNSYKLRFDGPCAPPPPTCVSPDKAKFHHEFGVENGKSTATVTLDEGIKLCEGEPVTLVSYVAPRPEFSVPQFVFDHASAVITTDKPRADLEVKVPDCNTQVDLFFGSEKDIIAEITANGPRYGDKKLGSPNGIGSRSVGKPGWFNGGSKACQQPAVATVPQCDGTLTVNLSNNGEISRYPIDFAVKTGDVTKTVTVGAGKAESITIPAGSGDVTIGAEGLETKTYQWQNPGDCALPTVVVENDCDTVAITVQNPKGVTPVTAKITYGEETKTATVASGASRKTTFTLGKEKHATVEFPGLDVESIKATLGKVDCGGEGGGGGLPVTGAAAGSIAGGAAALLAIGGGLFFLARRRKVTFTA